MATARLDARLLGLIVGLDGWSRGGINAVDRLLARESPRFEALDRGRHPVPTLVGCLQGVVRVTHAHGHRDLRPGELLAIAVGAWHVHDRLRPGSISYSLGTRHRHADLVVEDALGTSVLGLPFQPCATLLHRLVDCRNHQERIAIAQELARQLQGPATMLPFEVPDAVAQMGAFMNRRLGQPIRVNEMLDASGMCRRHARRMFIRFYGTTPKQEITRYRLAIASQQLREGADIAAAADAGGFSSRADFTRTWRRIHGVPPSVTRARDQRPNSKRRASSRSG